MRTWCFISFYSSSFCLLVVFCVAVNSSKLLLPTAVYYTDYYNNRPRKKASEQQYCERTSKRYARQSESVAEMAAACVAFPSVCAVLPSNESHAVLHLCGLDGTRGRIGSLAFSRPLPYVSRSTGKLHVVHASSSRALLPTYEYMYASPYKAFVIIRLQRQRCGGGSSSWYFFPRSIKRRCMYDVDVCMCGGFSAAAVAFVVAVGSGGTTLCTCYCSSNSTRTNLDERTRGGSGGRAQSM